MSVPNVDIEKKLSESNIKPTTVRILVYKTLLSSINPLSLLDIEVILETVDRSSISRTLSLFKDNHLVHAFVDGSGSVKYEVCHSDHHSLDDLHVHFHCEKCENTFCLSNVKVPDIDLPQGFVLKNVNYVVTGICDKCSRH